MEAETSLVQPGARLGAYLLASEIGRGGMATVFAAEHTGLKKRVAVKVLHPSLARTKVAAARFEREGRAIARIRHPHVIDVVDVGISDGAPYLVMQLVEGPTLASLIRHDAPMPLDRVAELLLPVISAASAAHTAGVIHRDLKPSNVLIATGLHGEPSPVVVDFGISKVADPAEADLTHDHAAIGTLVYMAPEQLRSSSHVDARADQWALGVMLYQAATGELPFSGESTPEIMSAILAQGVSGDLRPPSAVRKGLPAAFDALVLRALARDPKKRFPDVRALGAALVPFAKGRAWSTWVAVFEARADQGTLDDSSGSHDPVPTEGALARTTTQRFDRRGLASIFVIAAVAVLFGATYIARTSNAPPVVEPVVAAPRVSLSVPPEPPPSVTPTPSVSASASPTPTKKLIALPRASASIVPSAPPPTHDPPKPQIGSNGAPILE